MRRIEWRLESGPHGGNLAVGRAQPGVSLSIGITTFICSNDPRGGCWVIVSAGRFPPSPEHPLWRPPPGRGPRALHGRGPCGKLQWSRAGEWAIIFQGRALPRTDRGPSDGSPRGRLPRRLRERPRRPRRGGPRGPRLGGGAAGRQGSGAAAPGRWQSDPFRAPPLRATPPHPALPSAGCRPPASLRCRRDPPLDCCVSLFLSMHVNPFTNSDAIYTKLHTYATSCVLNSIVKYFWGGGDDFPTGKSIHRGYASSPRGLFVRASTARYPSSPPTAVFRPQRNAGRTRFFFRAQKNHSKNDFEKSFEK